MSETFIDRLDRYKEYACLNDNQITIKSGLTVGIINSARKRGSSLSGENIEKIWSQWASQILRAFKDINARWLLTGEGEMIQNDGAFAASNSNNDSLTIYLGKENKELKVKNEELNREIGKLEGQIIELKKRVLVEDVAKCVIASGSDLAVENT